MKGRISDFARVAHILDAIHEIELYTKNSKGIDDIVNNSMLRNAIVRQLEIIGEASSKMSHETRIKHSNVPWEKIISLRNVLIHEYFDVDPYILWDIVSLELNPLLSEITLIHTELLRHQEQDKNKP